MRKYQLWLERKSYSQHLTNLIKIKYEKNSQEQFESMNQSQVNKEAASKHQSHTKNDFHKERQRLADVSYAITFKELKNRKLRIMKSFEILNENSSMARRINQAKSVFNLKKQKSSTIYDQRRQNEKKIENSHQQLRQKNFRKFVELQSKKTYKPIQKYQLSIKVEAFSKVISFHQYAGVWLEVEAGQNTYKSEMINAVNFINNKFVLPLETELPEQFTMKLYHCKGLQAINLGEFIILKPVLGKKEKVTSAAFHHEDSQTQIQFIIHYEKIKRTKRVLMFR